MSDRPWMPLDIDDYLADTSHLTAAEHGAYLLLIMRYWKDNGLPESDKLIQRYARLSDEQWAESREVLAAFFTDGWRHHRIDAEIEKAAGIIEKRRAAAIEKHAKGKRSASAVQVQSTSTDTGVPPVTSDIPSSLRSDGSAARKPANPRIVLQAEVDALTADRWVTHCEDKGKKPSAAQAEELCLVLRQVRELGANPNDALKLAIKRGWVSVDLEYLRNAGMKFTGTPPPGAEVDWTARLSVFRASGTWAHAWGPKPDEPGCRAPAELLQELAA
jgi:uncharacterized protein YdaU (DUF1376 family)